MKKSINFILLILSIGLYTNCDNEHEDIKATRGFESINSGTFTCYVDESLWNFLEPVYKMYDSAYPEINATFIMTTSRDAMAQLLSGNAKVIVTPREYLKDEDSLMKAFKVTPPDRKLFAEDGLIFYTSVDFPLDTLNSSQIKDVLLNKNSGLKKYYPELKEEPVFVCNNINSSEFANLITLVLKDNPDYSKLKFVENSNEVKQYVLNNPNSIGIGYMQQMINDTQLKGLRIGFVNDKGKYIFPHVVHQANILRRYYPYIVPYFVYLLEPGKDRVFWFSKYLETEAQVQKYFLNRGIVPTYAKIVLKESD